MSLLRILPLLIRRNAVPLSVFLLLPGILLVLYSDLSPGEKALSGMQATASPTMTVLSSLRWCGKPLLVFHDQRAAKIVETPAAHATGMVASDKGAAKIIDNWEQIKSELGFTVFLPATLPVGTCLMSALGTVHDRIFGGSFTIGYLLPDQSAISLSEAPLHSQSTGLQCSPSSTKATVTPSRAQAPLQLCFGAQEKTHIVFSAQGTKESLEKFFRALQPNVNWVPTR
jgi:hypothetical protein